MQQKTELNLIRAIYFAQCFVGCCVSNFLVLYLAYRNLDLHEIGIVVGTIYPFSQMLGQPLWTSLADALGGHKFCMLTSLVLGTAVVYCALFVTTFLGVSLTVGGGAFLMAGVNPLLDNITMKSLDFHKKPLTSYGKFRVFGAIGYGLSALVLGPLIDYFGVTVIFQAFAITSLFYFILIATFPFRTTISSSNSEHSSLLGSDHSQNQDIAAGSPSHCIQSGSQYDVKDLPSVQSDVIVPAELQTKNVAPSSRVDKDESQGYLRKLLSGRFVVLFCFMVVCMGVGKGVIDGFLFLYLQDLNAPATLLGLTLGVTTVSEIPFFFYSGYLISRFGAIYTVAMALCAYAIRLLYYSQLQEPWFVLPIELLHGLTFGLSWAAVASHSYQISPKGYQATTQGLVSALFWGFGFGSGACGGGFINQAYGYVCLFWTASAFTATACIIGLGWYFLEQHFRTSCSHRIS